MQRERLPLDSAGRLAAASLPAWRVDGPLLLRLAAFPALRLARLAMPLSLAWQQRMAGQERLLDGERADVCERILFHAAGRHRGGDKSALVALKRRLYNRQALQDTDRGTLSLLPLLRERRQVLRYALRLARLARWSSVAQQVFAGELALRRQGLQQLVVADDFLLGLQLHNPSLAAQARKLALRDPLHWRKAERSTEATLVRYLARATVKTSPFGRWGLVAPLGGAPLSAGLKLDAASARVGVRSSLNLQLCARIATQVEAGFAVHARLPLLPNPTRFREGDSSGFFSAAAPGANVPFTKLRSGRLAAPVEQLLALLEAAGQGLCKAELVERALGVPALAGLGHAKLGALVDQMQRAGMVSQASLLPSDELDGLTTFAARLSALLGAQAQPACAALLELSALGRDYAAGDVAGRAAARARIGQLCAGLGVDTSDALAPVIEDSVVLGVRGSIGAPLRQALQEQLGPLLSLYARRDANGLQMRMLVDIFVAAYGPGGRCDNPSHFAAQALRLCQQHAADDARVFPRFVRARQAQERFMQVLAGLPASAGGDVALGRQDLDTLAAACDEGAVGGCAPRRLGLLVQVVGASAAAVEDGDFDVVLNQTLPGWGRFQTRYAQLIDDPSWSAALRSVLERLGALCGGEVLVLQTALQHNGHVFPALTPNALAMPGESSARADLLAFERLSIAHDTASDTLSFAYDGQPVLPLYLGCLHTTALPPLQRVLADAVPPYAYQAASLKPVEFMERQHAPGRPALRAYPRLRYGRVILQRRCWAVDIGALPADAADDYALFRSYLAWQRQHGLPGRVYVRVSARLDGENRPGDHKPVFLDFANHLLLRSFVAGLERASVRTLVFEEALPDPDCAGTDLGLGGAHVVELQLEMEEGAP